eukprot:CAMPEP_0114997098 /NCGR_PEP_ID=MMETSP0216-20121206/14704_1 /TAXON_ID=223996 /ORGANISM="Protocruzia adherens, Strain Boccale" /LENGTH=73 /DNA_ID=CAMNT_0002361429 /DNA_START=399 /DNA_END=616 /DNA_ORIENTATION=+
MAESFLDYIDRSGYGGVSHPVMIEAQNKLQNNVAFVVAFLELYMHRVKVYEQMDMFGEILSMPKMCNQPQRVA